MIKFFRRKTHKSDEYFRQKFTVPMGREAFCTVTEAHAIRHRFPDLSGPELVRLVYWGASGAVE
jgi:hypothetical protein